MCFECSSRHSKHKYKNQPITTCVYFDIWVWFFSFSRAPFPSIRLLGDRGICTHSWGRTQDPMHNTQSQLLLQRHLEIHNQISQYKIFLRFTVILIKILIFSFSSLNIFMYLSSGPKNHWDSSLQWWKSPGHREHTDYRCCEPGRHRKHLLHRF